MKKLGYKVKLETMFHEVIIKGKYIETSVNVLKNCRAFRTFYIENLIILNLIKI